MFLISTNNISPYLNSTKGVKRVGRGKGSGKGGFAGRGCKGQNARTGKGKVKIGFEGGQTPLLRRMPKKRGFTALSPSSFAIVNISDLNKIALDGISTINNEVLLQRNLIKKKDLLIKLLGNGEITNKINVVVNRASKQAVEKIEKAGGKVELV